jgi:hypothetical protein
MLITILLNVQIYGQQLIGELCILKDTSETVIIFSSKDTLLPIDTFKKEDVLHFSIIKGNFYKVLGLKWNTSKVIEGYVQAEKINPLKTLKENQRLVILDNIFLKKEFLLNQNSSRDSIQKVKSNNNDRFDSYVFIPAIQTLSQLKNHSKKVGYISKLMYVIQMNESIYLQEQLYIFKDFYLKDRKLALKAFSILPRNQKDNFINTVNYNSGWLLNTKQIENFNTQFLSYK